MDIGIVLLFISTLAGALAGGAVGFFARANRSVQLKDTTEKLLADSVPQATVDQVNNLANRALDQVDSAAQIVKDALQFMRDVTDRKPNEVALKIPASMQGAAKAEIQDTLQRLVNDAQLAPVEIVSTGGTVN